MFSPATTGELSTSGTVTSMTVNRFQNSGILWRTLFISVLFSMLLAISLSSGCDRFPGSVKSRRIRTALIGLDGATWDMIIPLIKDGSLPNLSKMMEEGVYGNLLSDPPYSPPSWTSIATGKAPEHHGVEDFVRKCYRYPGSGSGVYELIPVEGTMVRSARIWDILSYHSWKSGVCYYLFTWPVEQFDGVMISDYRGEAEDFLQFRNIQSEIYDAFTQKRFLDADLRFTTDPALALDVETSEERFRSRDRRVADEILKIDQVISTSEFILQEFPELDFFTVTFYWGNYMQHEFMHYLYPEYYRLGEEEVARYGHVIPMLYGTFDEFIGKLRRDRSIEAVMIVSDHGMEPLRWEDETFLGCYHFNILINRFLEEFGYYEKLPGSDEMDPEKTRAFECRYRRTEKGVSLNLEKHYPESGPDLSARAVRRMKADLVEKFSGIRFRESGKPLFGKVMENPEGWPDIIFDEYHSFPYSETLQLLSSEILVNGRTFLLKDFCRYPGFKTRAEHGYDFNGQKPYGENGIFIFSGPPVNRNKNINLRTIDILPNLLYSLGLPLARDMDGELVGDIFSPGFRRRNQVEYVDSYDMLLKKEYMHASPSLYHEEMMDRLKSLGYVQ